MSQFGYALYVALIFLPGIGVGELLRVWSPEESLTVKVAYSFGIGLAVDTLVILTKTSGASIAGYRLVGLDLPFVYFVILSGLAVLLITIIARRRFTFPVRPTKTDTTVFALILLQATMLLLYFQKYPIFPEYQSGDFSAHVLIAESLISGTPSFPTGILYFGVHFQLASAILLIGGDALITAQRAMSLLVLFSVPLVYLVSRRIFSSNVVGLIAAALYVLSGTIWFVSVYDTGLYANFFGILAIFFLIVALLAVQKDFRSVSAWILFVLAIALTYLSHYTALTLFPTLLVLPFLEYLNSRSGLKEFLIPSVVILVPAAIAALVYPKFVANLLVVGTQGGGVTIGGTYLSGVLSGIPALGYMAEEINYDLGFLAFTVFSAIFIWKGRVMKNPIFLLPALWFLSIIAASAFSSGAWRFAYEALVPFTLMAAYGMFVILPKNTHHKKNKEHGYGWKPILLLVVILIPTLSGGWGVMMVTDATTSTAVASQSQSLVYSSLNWLKVNTAPNSTYLSVSDSRFTYSNIIISRVTIYQFFSAPGDAIAFAQQEHIPYIIVTNLVTSSLPPVPSLFPWNNFPTSSNSNLTLVYTNPDVRIYKLA